MQSPRNASIATLLGASCAKIDTRLTERSACTCREVLSLARRELVESGPYDWENIVRRREARILREGMKSEEFSDSVYEV